MARASEPTFWVECDDYRHPKPQTAAKAQALVDRLDTQAHCPLPHRAVPASGS